MNFPEWDSSLGPLSNNSEPSFARHQVFNNIMAAITQQIAEEQKERALMLIG